MNKQGSLFAPLVGRAIDLYRLANYQLANPHSLAKVGLIKEIQKRHQASTFIESGTYLGVTTKRLHRCFNKIYTFEIDAKLASRAKKFLDSYTNIIPAHGDALEGIRNVLGNKAPGETFMLFLDGHVTHGPCNPDYPEPAILEIEYASRHKEAIEAIVIDDFGNFGLESGFPKKSELISACEDLLSEDNFIISIEYDMLAITRRDKRCQSPMS